MQLKTNDEKVLRKMDSYPNQKTFSIDDLSLITGLTMGQTRIAICRLIEADLVNVKLSTRQFYIKGSGKIFKIKRKIKQEDKRSNRLKKLKKAINRIRSTPPKINIQR